MRDINRIDKFCDELKELWKTPMCRDMRFGQFISNVFGDIYDETKRDLWFMEESEMMYNIRKIVNKYNGVKYD